MCVEAAHACERTDHRVGESTWRSWRAIGSGRIDILRAPREMLLCSESDRRITVYTTVRGVLSAPSNAKEQDVAENFEIFVACVFACGLWRGACGGRRHERSSLTDAIRNGARNAQKYVVIGKAVPTHEQQFQHVDTHTAPHQRVIQRSYLFA